MNRYIIFFCSFFVPCLLMAQAGVITYNKKYSWANIAKKMPYLSQEEKDRITFITSKTATIYAEQGVKATKGLGINSNDVLKEHSRAIAAAINANPAILDTESVAAVVKLALKTPGYYNEHEALNKALKTHCVNSVTDAAFEGVEIQGSTLIACAKFITSKTATIYAEQGVKAERSRHKQYNALKEHSRDIAAAINANPAILDQNSVAAVVNLALKTPGL